MVNCVVRGCRSSWYPGSHIRFHGFPTETARRNVWLSAVPLKNKFSNNAKICSLHFKQADYGDYSKNRNHLKETAVPFYNIKTEPTEVEQSSDDQPSSFTYEVPNSEINASASSSVFSKERLTYYDDEPSNSSLIPRINFGMNTSASSSVFLKEGHIIHDGETSNSTLIPSINFGVNTSASPSVFLKEGQIIYDDETSSTTSVPSIIFVDNTSASSSSSVCSEIAKTNRGVQVNVEAPRQNHKGVQAKIKPLPQNRGVQVNIKPLRQNRGVQVNIKTPRQNNRVVEANIKPPRQSNKGIQVNIKTPREVKWQTQNKILKQKITRQRMYLQRIKSLIALVKHYASHSEIEN